MDTRARFFYGMPLGIEANNLPCFDKKTDPSTFYAHKKGVVTPSVKFTEENGEIYREYWNQLRENYSEFCDCTNFGCYDADERYHAVYIRGTHAAVEWEYVHQFANGFFSVDPSWNDKIKEYCEFMGIPFDESKCAWTLALDI